MPDTTQPTSVKSLDLARYLGLWYEAGRLPLRFEDDHAVDVTAEYTLREDDKIEVDNRCIDADGVPTQATGVAEPDTEHPGRLSVSFLPEGLRWIPFTRADYWVLKIDDDYQTALVGTPDHKHLWLLSRTPSVPHDVEEAYLAAARHQGYDLSEWINTRQSGRRVTTEMLHTDGAS